jgi:hypothetical protein
VRQSGIDRRYAAAVPRSRDNPEEAKRAEVYVRDSSNAHLYKGGPNDGNHLAIYICNEVARRLLEGYGHLPPVMAQFPRTKILAYPVIALKY